MPKSVTAERAATVLPASLWAQIPQVWRDAIIANARSASPIRLDGDTALLADPAAAVQVVPQGATFADAEGIDIRGVSPWILRVRKGRDDLVYADFEVLGVNWS